MRHRNALAWSLAGALAFGASGLLYAQTREMSPVEMPGMMQSCPMMHVMAQGPAAVLAHRDTLDLSEDQVRRLESFRDRVASAHRSGMVGMREFHHSIDELSIDDAFDEDATREALDRMAEIHAEMGMLMLRARFESLRVLTAQQRGILADLPPQGMMGMMHGMRSGGMNGMHGHARGMMGMSMHCPMMGGDASDGADAGGTPLGEER